MDLVVRKSGLQGEITIPASKSHTIRAVVIASLAEGKSRLIGALDSMDTMAAVNACKAFGAEIDFKGDMLVNGFAGKPKTPAKEIDLMNSGTSTNMAAGIAANAKGPTVLSGDESLKSRPFAPMAKALNGLGAKAESLSGNGMLPMKISGFLQGGSIEIDGMNSQPVSSLLINCALAPNDSEIIVPDLHEQPYVRMTMQWLDEQGIKYSEKSMEHFTVQGGQSFKAFEKPIAGDFSSATFPLCAAAIAEGNEVFLKGLDMNDSQGDKKVVNMLRSMGAEIKLEKNGIRVFGGKLQGKELDLNSTPDALPALAVVGCAAEGETRLVNVGQARIKETDRISAMALELKKMGADIKELEDGLVIRKSSLHGAAVDGMQDHRLVMALSLAGMVAEGSTSINTAEAVKITFPNYVELMHSLGAEMELVK